MINQENLCENENFVRVKECVSKEPEKLLNTSLMLVVRIRIKGWAERRSNEKGLPRGSRSFHYGEMKIVWNGKVDGCTTL